MTPKCTVPRHDRTAALGDSLLRAPYSVPPAADLDGLLRTTDSLLRALVSEVSLGKRASGSGLQVALEASCDCDIGELKRDDERPWPVMDSHAGRTGVVPVQALDDITREADVMAIGVAVAAEDVDEALRFHALSLARRRPASGARIH